MPRVLILSDDGEVVWNERATASDFEGELHRRCLADRLGWTVAHAESDWRLSTVKPIRIDEADQRPRKRATSLQSTAAAT